MKRILISESQVRGLLYEALSVDATFNKFYANSMSRDDFEKIIHADPTYGGGEQMGKYSQWLLTMVKKNKLNIDELPKATELLNKYNLNKNKFKSKNIDDYKSVDDLYKEYESMEDELSSSSKRSQEQEAKRGAKKVYEDSEWLVIVPETQEASCYYGKGTQWCTAAVESQNYFDDYNESGDLYININKESKEKYQFHFEREEFRDAQNEDLTELSQDKGESIAQYCGFTGGLIKFYENGPDNNGVLNEENGLELFSNGVGAYFYKNGNRIRYYYNRSEDFLYLPDSIEIESNKDFLVSIDRGSIFGIYTKPEFNKIYNFNKNRFLTEEEIFKIIFNDFEYDIDRFITYVIMEDKEEDNDELEKIKVEIEKTGKLTSLKAVQYHDGEMNYLDFTISAVVDGKTYELNASDDFDRIDLNNFHEYFFNI